MTDADPTARGDGLRPLLVIVGLVVGLLVVVGFASTSSLGRLGEILPAAPISITLPTQTPQTRPTVSSSPFQMPDQGPPVQLPEWARNAIPFLIAAAALVAIAILVRLVAGNLRGKALHKAGGVHTSGVAIPELDADQVASEFDEALDQLRSGVGVDDAILECWRRLERVAARQGVERRPEQTAGEFVTDLLAGTTAPADALDELARLYRLAMFSTHPRTEHDRARAIACLDRLSHALRPTPQPIEPVVTP
ncbi:DUF4129 domain-containing protein [Aestuariimicrobium sp. T2.26MG-19.2B]|uniref:DUF4129 domain-containing protein n=1 Tax=Aestuariimicrobium sp. T2.26MG-19.2B TaxID=3040679 RepID=UPI00247760B3|nr:DUF4129 domain-containing protein [Aestuariimicrobium sp. T2.26MG-19.2B]CAI9405025.1 hypothetical protein AESSP_01329 [Aestuariimicrobium sp. T2.26MG-19.2B]